MNSIVDIVVWWLVRPDVLQHVVNSARSASHPRVRVHSAATASHSSVPFLFLC